MSIRLSTCCLVVWLICGRIVAAAPSPSPRGHVQREASAISIFRVRCDNPGRGFYGRGGAGLPYERVTGTVWFANRTDDTLTDVVMTVDFWDERYYRTDGSRDYAVGSLGPRQSMAVDFRWDNWQHERVTTRVFVTYKKPGDLEPHKVIWDGYGP